MNTINVMRQAIEALEYHTAQTRPVLGTEAAITALRAELERLDAVEPVAWRIFDGEGGYDFRDELPSEESREWSARYGRKWEPLYTAPIAPAIPAPTHEQIDEGWIQCGGSGSAYDAWHDGARWAYDLAAKRAQAMVLGG